jgi:hypothetical protein
MNKRTFKLAPISRAFIVKAVTEAPDGYVVKIQEPTRSLDQNAKLWPMLEDVASQVIWYGKRLTTWNWKDVFTAALRKQEVIPGIDGGFVVCGQHTSDMGRKEFSDLIELIYAFGSEQGVKWSEPAAKVYDLHGKAA